MAWYAIIVLRVVRISIAIIVVLMVGTYDVRPEPVFESSDGLQKIYALSTDTFRPPQSLTAPSTVDVLRRLKLANERPDKAIGGEELPQKW
jgi:hypothetical protein